MRAKRRGTIVLISGMLASAALILLLSPAAGGAAACPNTAEQICASQPGGADCDGDGFTDQEECVGIALYGSNAHFPGYNERGDLDRTGYLDPSAPDLFFFLVRANPSLIPTAGPAGIYTAGLNVTTHEISASDVGTGGANDRRVTPAQKAVRITESLDTTGTIFGAAEQGTPNGLDGATVYTQRIANFVSSRCANASVCKDVSGAAGIPGVTNLYIRNVIAHESGHVSNLTPEWSRRYGWHYAAGSGTVMEQSAKYTSSKGVVIFYLSQQYTPGDVAGVTLK